MVSKLGCGNVKRAGKDVKNILLGCVVYTKIKHKNQEKGRVSLKMCGIVCCGMCKRVDVSSPYVGNRQTAPPEREKRCSNCDVVCRKLWNHVARYNKL